MKVPQAWSKGGPVSLTAFKLDAGAHSVKVNPVNGKATTTKLEARGDHIIEQPGTELNAEGDVARWWQEMSDASKEEYVAEHPNSKYADMHRSEKVSVDKQPSPAPASESKPEPKAEKPVPESKPHAETPAPKPAPAAKPYHKPAGHGPGHQGHAPAPQKPKAPSDKPPADAHHENVGTPDKGSVGKLLADPENAPGSPKRKALVGFLRKKTGHILSHLKKDAKEWKHAGHALKKLTTGKPLDHSDKHAMGAVAADLATVTASLLLTGGAAHGIMAFMTHFGTHLAQEAMLKAAVKGAAGAAAHASIRVLTTASDEDRIMQDAIKYMMEALENGDLEEMMKRFEAQAAKEGEGPEAKKEVREASTVTAGSAVEAKLDMSENTLGKGNCPDCKTPMVIAHINGESEAPAWACRACRISVPLPNDHDYFNKQDQGQEKDRPLVG